MKIKNILFFILLIFSLLILNKTFALQIKNVNYSASNNNDRWIEVFNDGTDIEDFTLNNYKVIDSTDETNHRINTLLGDKSFPGGTTIFISPSTSLPPGAEKVFRSPYSINKTNGYIIVDDNGVKLCFNYGDLVCPESGSVQNSETISSSTDASSIKEKIVYVYIPQNNQDKYGDIQVLLPEEKTVIALAENEYTVKVTDSSKKVIDGLDFHWSFGDGGEKIGKDSLYTYTYPGEYILIASADGYISGGKAKMIVRVVDPNIIIQEIGVGDKENFIIIKNNTEYDLFLSNFYLQLDDHFYKLPKNLIVAKNKPLKLSGEALGFSLPANNISLLYPNKNILTTFKKEISIATSSNAESIENISNFFSKGDIKENEIIQKIDLAKENIFQTKNIQNNKILEVPKVVRKGESDDKIDTNSIYLKRLVLDKDFSRYKPLRLKGLKENKGENIIEYKDVDTGIVDRIKNLIY